MEICRLKDQKKWEWLSKERGEEVRSDDVRMGETGRRLRRERWEEISDGELRREDMRMAEDCEKR